MGVDFTVFKGSKGGKVTEAKGHREPGPSEVIVRISHCGVCDTDEHYRHYDQGLGHKGIGVITEVGSFVHDVSEFRVGDRVGMGWFDKFCGYCKYCLKGNLMICCCVSNEILLISSQVFRIGVSTAHISVPQIRIKVALGVPLPGTCQHFSKSQTKFRLKKLVR
jgi:D-arabinose 1-dehydrogenase-like Zn-dependent alcohol dehydrogenase